ncbi:ATP synthase subunit g, mitochondrial [Nilaparvata lugens]|uniref:ATP synthase subunit g, mitochondrial n=1 Tax=Nilaparvata lugens TaxID=108931 RepID=UPI00193D72C0|nr:ATP synthase subunit g, mitochondrial [Nilaparvata lugens]
MATILKGLMDAAKPNLATFLRYAKAELTPPSPRDIGRVREGINDIVCGAKNGRWKELTVKEAWLNTLVATEVACWFFVGEVIGRGHFVGYKFPNEH